MQQDRPAIAILIKQHYRLEDACRCARALSDSGARISFFCVPESRPTRDHWDMAPLLDITLDCFTADANMASKFGLQNMSMATMARCVQDFDWVIPF